MLDVFFTVDVEVWCDGWDDIDAKFPRAFKQYIYGPTRRGQYGLPFTLAQFEEHGLLGVFFVEALFAARFGLEPLAEIVGLLRERGQEVQLHLHTEWVDEARQALLPNVSDKTQHLKYFPYPEQRVLIAAGIDFLKRANAGTVNTFRAGSFAFNCDTLKAVADNGIQYDCSYNASAFGLNSGLMPGVPIVEPVQFENVYEYPMTVFNDGTSMLRPAQLTACSFSEMEGLLWQAVETERKAFVILSHNFELLNRAKDRPDDVVVKRFQKLCRFLQRHQDCFRVRGFRDLKGSGVTLQPGPLVSSSWKTGIRVVQQVLRRTYG
jgi:hypothetical protein